VFEVEVKAVAMQKALLAAASRTALFSHFGGGAAGAAVSVKLQNGESRVRWQGMVTKAGQQVEQAGEDPKVEVSSSDEENEAGMHPHTRKAYRFAPCSHYKRVW
jgi:adenosylcobinamide amidohydrolase